VLFQEDCLTVLDRIAAESVDCSSSIRLSISAAVDRVRAHDLSLAFVGIERDGTGPALRGPKALS